MADSGADGRPRPKGLSVEDMMRARAKQTRQRLTIVAIVVVAVVAAAVVAAWILNRNADEPAPPPTAPAPTAASGASSAGAPAGALDDGGILLGQDLVPGGPAPSPDQAVTVEVMSDYLCPVCGMLEQAHGQALAAKAQAGEIRLVIHPVNNTNLNVYNDLYSWRAMLAVDTVAALEPDKFWAFNESLWANQPPESKDTGDLTDEAIAELAAQAGVGQDTIDQLVDSPVEPWATWSSGEASKRIGGTPTVFMSFNGSEPQIWNGWLLQGTDEAGETQYFAGDLDAAIANVKAGKAPDAE
ncbi:MAG: DsbA family protein [Bifidobacteriaceae bacterium]|jgi:protein-disulfide isomerase|nr:DsbA family protein [Bifidobacteriaceae bacterium]